MISTYWEGKMAENVCGKTEPLTRQLILLNVPPVLPSSLHMSVLPARHFAKYFSFTEESILLVTEFRFVRYDSGRSRELEKIRRERDVLIVINDDGRKHCLGLPPALTHVER